MIGIPLGLLYSNAGEWLLHKYVLHGLGKRKKSFWSFHWHNHHKEVRRNEHIDEAYDDSPFQWNAQGKEVASLLALGLGHAPLFPVAPFFTATVWYSMVNYYRVHKKSHLDPEWAKENLPWHYDHHMGPNQDANWCVTRPWFDVLMGTREPYVGTEQEQNDIAKREAHKQRREEQRQAMAA
ncbi:MAG: hypothetical protein EP343_23230 [Deltaproteobacteria bacterium]|nr:MAG: hypothetical protein EP343_23230 [Deltaproteobacteria bacterium]